jgi:DNA-binding NarL/FixJ family response regulator
MDINMPEMNGIEATRQIVSAHPDVVVFLCSTYDVEDLPSGAADSGASAYVNKERFGAETLRQLWAGRNSGSFATA